MWTDRVIMDPEVQANILEVGGIPLLQEMLSLFIQQLDHYGPLIEVALTERDLPELKAQLHAMKSAASSLGFVRLAGCLHDFEKATQPPTNAPVLTEYAVSWRAQVQSAKEAAQSSLKVL